ncbi:MAG: LysR substrate-binding domain-containing protein [Pseudomonadota bacterium]
MTLPFETRALPPPFSALRAFEAVGRLGGIRRAALELGLDHAVVSRHLRALEEWAGVPLMNRQREARALTDMGERLHKRISLALQEISDATAELQLVRGAKALRIWCVPGLALEWLTCRLPHFCALYPQVELALRSSDKSPDFGAHEAEVDIRYIFGEQSVDPAVVSGAARRVELARPPVFPVASPQLRDSLGELASAGDLLQAPLLHEEGDGQWRSWFLANDVTRVEHLAGPRLWHAHLALAAARQGQGVVLANPYLLHDDLETGRLVRLLDSGNSSPTTLGAYVFSARADRWHASAIADFRRWLRSEMAARTPRHSGALARSGAPIVGTITAN